MKKLSFLKLALLLPVLGIAFSSCKKEQSPYLSASMLAFASQVNYPVGTNRFIFSPDLRAGTQSSSDIISWNFQKNGVPYSAGFNSPFRGAYEVELKQYPDLYSMNGEYTFNATNAGGEKATLSIAWNFLQAGEGMSKATMPFLESWGEAPYDDDGNVVEGSRRTADHYDEFEYHNGRVNAVIKPFINEGTTVSYAIVYALYVKTGVGGPNSNPGNDPGSYRLSRVAGGASELYTPPSSTSTVLIPMSLYLPNTNPEYDWAQVALVAIKQVQGSNGTAGQVMMRTEYKTIRKDMNWFMEDGNPEPPQHPE